MSVRARSLRSPLSVLGAPLCVLALAALAAGQEGDPAAPAAPAGLAVVVSTARTQVPVGEMFRFSVRIENRGQTPAQVRPVRLSSHATFVELGGGEWERPYYYLQYPGGIPEIRPAAQQTLAPGEAIEGVLEWPALTVGKFTVRVGFTGHFGWPLPAGQQIEPLYSEALGCEAVPSAAGAVRLEAVMETNLGQARFRFYPDVAPGTVANFVTLARRGFYSKLGFHRVIKGFMIQGGDPAGNGSGGPGYSIPAEFTRRYKHQPGTLAMARTQHPHTAGSQFYVCLGSPAHLDGSYTIFGQVVSGQETIDAIGALPVDGSVPKTPATITSIRIEPVDAEGKPCPVAEEPKPEAEEPKPEAEEPKPEAAEPKPEAEETQPEAEEPKQPEQPSGE